MQFYFIEFAIYQIHTTYLPLTEMHYLFIFVVFWTTLHKFFLKLISFSCWLLFSIQKEIYDRPCVGSLSVQTGFNLLHEEGSQSWWNFCVNNSIALGKISLAILSSYPFVLIFLHSCLRSIFALTSFSLLYKRVLYAIHIYSGDTEYSIDITLRAVLKLLLQFVVTTFSLAHFAYRNT